MYAGTLNDIGTIGPIGGIAALFVVMLKMVWSDNASRRVIEGKLRDEWADDRKGLVSYYESALARLENEFATRIASLTVIHDTEIASLNRRIAALEADNARLKGP